MCDFSRTYSCFAGSQTGPHQNGAGPENGRHCAHQDSFQAYARKPKQGCTFRSSCKRRSRKVYFAYFHCMHPHVSILARDGGKLFLCPRKNMLPYLPKHARFCIVFNAQGINHRSSVEWTTCSRAMDRPSIAHGCFKRYGFPLFNCTATNTFPVASGFGTRWRKVLEFHCYSFVRFLADCFYYQDEMLRWRMHTFHSQTHAKLVWRSTQTLGWWWLPLVLCSLLVSST